MTTPTPPKQKFLPRVWLYKYVRDEGIQGVYEKAFKHNYPGNLLPYLSLEEHEAKLSSLALENERLKAALEQYAAEPVYRRPADWNSFKEGGPPSIEECEEISYIAKEALIPEVKNEKTTL
jgi:uncharacterized small protein (DUF1192 family)